MRKGKIINKDSKYYGKVGMVMNESGISYAIKFDDVEGEKYFSKKEVKIIQGGI